VRSRDIVLIRLQTGQLTDSLQDKDIFLFCQASRLSVEPTQPPIPWAPRSLSVDG